MGEYIQYKGESTNLGVAESLYYTTYQKLATAYEANLLGKKPYHPTPEYYLQPDSGYLFRFPFPDEDKNPIGFHTDNDFRGVTVKVTQDLLEKLGNRNPVDSVDIVMQKLYTRKSDGNIQLGTVVKLPGEINYTHIIEEQAMMSLLKSIIKNHIYHERNAASKLFYQTIAARILKGYRLENELKQKHYPRPNVIRKTNGGKKL